VHEEQEDGADDEEDEGEAVPAPAGALRKEPEDAGDEDYFGESEGGDANVIKHTEIASSATNRFTNPEKIRPAQERGAEQEKPGKDERAFFCDVHISGGF